MKPSDFRTFATACLRVECGISTRSWRARAPLRMRESMSEMGSVIMGSPARLDHAGDFAAEGVEAQTNAAQLELAVVRATASADLAPVDVAHGKLGCSVELRKLTCTGHRSSSFIRVSSGRPEGHAHVLKKGAALFVGVGARHDR